jgi:predicted dienelactone hydrolase
VGLSPTAVALAAYSNTIRSRVKTICCGLGSLAIALVAHPGLAAERLTISYGLLERSIVIDDLEAFAETGQLSPQLLAYNQRLQLDAAQLGQVRDWLITPADLDAIAVAQFLYTEQGKFLLKQLTQVMQTPAHRGSFSALRSALILAAADENNGGLTLLNVLRQYPVDSIRINLDQGLAIAQSLNRAILEAELAVELVQTRSQEDAEANPIANVNQLLQQMQGQQQYGVRRLNLVVPGLSQPADLYLPRIFPRGAGTPVDGFPLVVISHGLGSTSRSFAYLAEYLATSGIAVAAIEHSGSNDQQILALIEGRSDSIVADEEFLRRPREVSLTLDALRRAQATNPALRGQLNFAQVGLVGQSFGGYTGLALAGANFDLEHLGQACPPESLPLNPSILLQCQATRLGNPDGELQDPRVRALFIINPIGSVVFGEDGYGQVDVPTLMVSGTADTVAPAFPEQIQPFTWLGDPDHYLLLIDQGTHFSAIGDVGEDGQPLAIPPELVGPQPELVRSYLQVMATAFFKYTLTQDQRFAPFLTASFVENLGTEPHPLSLITTLTPEELQNALE